MTVVNTTNQAQWDIVTKELGLEWYNPESNWTRYQDQSCINISSASYGRLEFYQSYNDRFNVLSFIEWAKTHCKNKYANNPVVRCTSLSIVKKIDSSTIEIFGTDIRAKYFDGSDLYQVLYNSVNNRFAFILDDVNVVDIAPKDNDIVILERGEREIIGYEAPIDFRNGLIKKGTKSHDKNDLFYQFCIENSLSEVSVEIEIVEAYFTPIYKKTEAEEKAEIWYEFCDAWIDSNINSVDEYYKQQTKFKLVRN